MIHHGDEAGRDREVETTEALVERARVRVRQGFAPPPEIYRLPHRARIDWHTFPSWARPQDPEAFDGCCHEG